MAATAAVCGIDSPGYPAILKLKRPAPPWSGAFFYLYYCFDLKMNLTEKGRPIFLGAA